MAALHVIGIDFQFRLGRELGPLGQQHRLADLIAIGLLRAGAHEDLALEHPRRAVLEQQLPIHPSLLEMIRALGRVDSIHCMAHHVRRHLSNRSEARLRLEQLRIVQRLLRMEKLTQHVLWHLGRADQRRVAVSPPFDAEALCLRLLTIARDYPHDRIGLLLLLQNLRRMPQRRGGYMRRGGYILSMGAACWLW